MSKISVIIPFYKNLDTIDRLIRSLEDQDFKDFNATIVIDGEDKEAQEYLVKRYYTDGKYNTAFPLYVEMMLVNGGASVARNFGAQMSKENLEQDNRGNILFFIDADCELYPGTLRLAANELEDKDVDFIYGNYRYDNKFNYISRKFDPYMLKTMNYISTMSPVKRKAFEKVGGFKKNQPYFQDWSLFYRLSEAGYKGKYINQCFFTTKQSNEDNISGTKGMTLSEKASEFRKWHDIEDKKLVVTSYGAEHQAIQRAKMLDADYVGTQQGESRVMPSNYCFDNWKATYMVGCYNQTPEALANHFASMVGKKIFHFIGTDVFQMVNAHTVAALKDFRRVFKENEAKIFVNSPRCLEEMHECGFSDAELLYTPIYNIEQYQWMAEMPKTFTIGVYFSDSNPMMRLDGAGGMSNLPLIVDVAQALPQFKFKFFGGITKYKPQDIEKKVPENIEYCGRIPEERMNQFINQCSMIVRSTIHDGFPQSPIQFLLAGRQALVSCPDESLKYAEKLSFEEIYDKYDDAKEEIVSKIIDMSKKQDSLKDKCIEIQKYYADLMNVDKFKEKIYKCI